MGGKLRKHAPPPDRAEGIILLNRWLRAIAALLGADAGCVVVNEGGITRIVARHNIPYAFMARQDPPAALPYPPDEELLVKDATARPELHAFLGPIALPATGFFYRRPLSIAPDRSISLVVFGQTPRPQIALREIELAREVADEMAKEVERHYPQGQGGLAASLGLRLSDVTAWLEKTDLPAALFDASLRLMAVNARMRVLLQLDWDAMIGKPLPELNLPAAGSIDFLFRHALQTQLSTPPMDVSLQDSAGRGLPGMLTVVGAPIVSTDEGPLLIATINPDVSMPPPRALADADSDKREATADFLLETLVRRRSLRSRKDVSFVTLRSWRQPIRAHQIAALKAVKRHAPASLAAEAAAEIADDVRSLFGGGGFRAVVPMPCGHSGRGRCLSVAIGQALARDLGLPLAHALALAPQKGSSHPKSNVKRAAMTLTAQAEGPILLVDDVATSGQHIEEATRLLRGQGASVLAIAWIGGDADGEDNQA